MGQRSNVESRRSKAEWRAQFAAVRASLSDADYAAKSAAICDRLQALTVVQRATTVHCYWPLVARREIDTRPFIAACVAAGKRVVLPVVEAFGRGFYDAFLAETTAWRVCVVYEACLVDRLPSESHDIAASTVVTEQAVLGI